MLLREDISGPKDGITNLEVRQGVFQADVIYRVDLEKGHLDYLGGIRWWDNDLEVEIDPVILPGNLKAEVKEN